MEAYQPVRYGRARLSSGTWCRNHRKHPRRESDEARRRDGRGSAARPQRQKHPGPGTGVLPYVPQEGIEPPTGGLEGRCSIP